MSHPIPGHEYGEELPSYLRDLRLNSLQKAMGHAIKKAGKDMKRKNESDFQYLKRMVGAKNKALESKKQVPKYGRYGKTRPNMPHQSPHLPPGFKQSDLE